MVTILVTDGVDGPDRCTFRWFTLNHLPQQICNEFVIGHDRTQPLVSLRQSTLIRPDRHVRWRVLVGRGVHGIPRTGSIQRG